MKLIIEWTTHSRRYTIGVFEFLKAMGLDVSDEQLVATAKKLLEQNEVKAENPPH